ALPSLSSHAPAPPEIYTLSLHDALPICGVAALRIEDQLDELITGVPGLAQELCALALEERGQLVAQLVERCPQRGAPMLPALARDRKSTRLNSSHVAISYAVFCLKKKKK